MGGSDAGSRRRLAGLENAGEEVENVGRVLALCLVHVLVPAATFASTPQVVFFCIRVGLGRLRGPHQMREVDILAQDPSSH